MSPRRGPHVESRNLLVSFKAPFWSILFPASPPLHLPRRRDFWVALLLLVSSFAYGTHNLVRLKHGSRFTGTECFFGSAPPSRSFAFFSHALLFLSAPGNPRQAPRPPVSPTI